MVENYVSQKGQVKIPKMSPKKERREKQELEPLDQIKRERGSPGEKSEEKFKVKVKYIE